MDSARKGAKRLYLNGLTTTVHQITKPMAMRISTRENKARPPHIYADNWVYFLTGRTKDKKQYFESYERKNIFLSVWKNLQREYAIEVYHWILWSNHYHFLVKLPNGNELAKLINRLHSITSLLLNRNDNTHSRKIWSQYWDHCIRNEIDFWKHFNYITNNPVKHQWCATLAQAFTYPYSGNPQWVKKRGVEFLYAMIATYPVTNFTPEEVKLPLYTLNK